MPSDHGCSLADLQTDKTPTHYGVTYPPTDRVYLVGAELQYLNHLAIDNRVGSRRGLLGTGVAEKKIPLT